MISIGLSEDVATSISAASGLTETAADEFRKNNKSLVSLTEEQEFALLRLIAPHYEKMVRDSVDSDLAQHEFDALTCFAYNPAGRWSSVTSFINDGNLTDATSKIKEGVTSAGKVFVGLVKRRDDETNLLLNGRYEYHGVKIELP
ncbi:glycoside hydrolase family protein [Burkholderia sp. FERM BP-3421]|uniref:glycoside hydrolase family protein n=1 Tax=Burkholderia sp. FERM BP-3421 TaxID=1494466 RepID=UPI003FCD5502